MYLVRTCTVSVSVYLLAVLDRIAARAGSFQIKALGNHRERDIPLWDSPMSVHDQKPLKHVDGMMSGLTQGF